MKKVLIDIHNWVQAVKPNQPIPMNGLFRHADRLARDFEPAIILAGNETCALSPGLSRIENYLGKKIQVIGTSCIPDVFEHDISIPADVWVSLGVDQFNPLIPYFFGNVECVAVLHDVMSLHGQFGEENQKRFGLGVKHNATFLSVSKTTTNLFNDYLDLLQEDRLVIPYGCPHNGEIDTSAHRRSPYSLSVSTMFERKRISDAHDLALMSGKAVVHYHVGRQADASVSAWVACQPPDFRYLGELDDDDLRAQYLNASMFICASSDEGFSMPPMEAILYGVPYIFLSDIPVHREIYGECAINWFDPLDAESMLSAVKNPVASHPDDKLRLFERYKYETLIQPFKKHIGSN